MCLATTDQKGPKRCSGEPRAACEHCAAKVEVLKGDVSELEAQIAAPPPVSFADKTTRVEDIRREIDVAMENLSTPEQWQDWLAHASKFHKYSFVNQLLIRMQCPNATQVAGFNKWKEMGRAPLKGTKSIWINAPSTRKLKDKDGNVVTDDNGKEKTWTSFYPVPVFDISQTDGDPVPEPPVVRYTPAEGVAPPQMHTALEDQITKRGYRIEYRELPEKGPEGWTSFSSKEVVVSTRYGDAHTAMVLAHELAHIALSHGDDACEYHTGPGGERPAMEVEAESVAYVIGKRYGLESSSSAFAYIHNWAQGDTARVKGTAEAVVKACKEILGDIPEFAENSDTVDAAA
jgi:hypothetical protein